MQDHSQLFLYLPQAERLERLGALRMQEVEDNPLDAADIALLEMFDREGWSDEQQVAHILALGSESVGSSKR